jgi:CBS domain-containing protein
MGRGGEKAMKARDVMVSPVITVKPTASVKDVAKIFLENRISAVPVVDDQGKRLSASSVKVTCCIGRSPAGSDRGGSSP